MATRHSPLPTHHSRLLLATRHSPLYRTLTWPAADLYREASGVCRLRKCVRVCAAKWLHCAQNKCHGPAGTRSHHRAAIMPPEKHSLIRSPAQFDRPTIRPQGFNHCHQATWSRYSDQPYPTWLPARHRVSPSAIRVTFPSRRLRKGSMRITPPKPIRSPLHARVAPWARAQTRSWHSRINQNVPSQQGRPVRRKSDQAHWQCAHDRCVAPGMLLRPRGHGLTTSKTFLRISKLRGSARSRRVRAATVSGAT
ncbi:MAG: hypothetical protein KatS3mg077_1553 [Candidatus Binatia bacterium]|nr:MAG: hypothetical protein KatS3mg077_1553 [Candidatus Binatia bacterium]